MFREMRRHKQSLSDAQTLEILRSCTSGVLATAGDDDYPYAVPLSFAYEDGRLFFHFARAGHKMDSIARNDKVSFCVIQTDNVIREIVLLGYFGRLRRPKYPILRLPLPRRAGKGAGGWGNRYGETDLFPTKSCRAT